MTEPNGLNYMRARFYDPEVCRFISADPIGFEGGDLNLYAYVQNNPVMFVDPWGLCEENGTIWNLGNIFKWGGKAIAATGKTWTKTTGQIMSVVGVTLEPGGPGEMVGTIIGGGIGVGLGATAGAFIPLPGSMGLVGAAGGIGGGITGAKVGKFFDSFFVPHAGIADAPSYTDLPY